MPPEERESKGLSVLREGGAILRGTRAGGLHTGSARGSRLTLTHDWLEVGVRVKRDPTGKKGRTGNQTATSKVKEARIGCFQLRWTDHIQGEKELEMDRSPLEVQEVTLNFGKILLQQNEKRAQKLSVKIILIRVTAICFIRVIICCNM